MHQSLQGATFHVEHITPEAHGGLTELNNLALACPSCNLKKSDRETAADPLTKKSVPLFHPVRIHGTSIFIGRIMN
jgi:5-methylcytosine-specific restriction endonuclease McrA